MFRGPVGTYHTFFYICVYTVASFCAETTTFACRLWRQTLAGKAAVVTCVSLPPPPPLVLPGDEHVNFVFAFSIAAVQTHIHIASTSQLVQLMTAYPLSPASFPLLDPPKQEHLARVHFNQTFTYVAEWLRTTRPASGVGPLLTNGKGGSPLVSSPRSAATAASAADRSVYGSSAPSAAAAAAVEAAAAASAATGGVAADPDADGGGGLATPTKRGPATPTGTGTGTSSPASASLRSRVLRYVRRSGDRVQAWALMVVDVGRFLLVFPAVSPSHEFQGELF